MARIISGLLGLLFLILGIIGIIFPFLPIGIICTMLAMIFLIPAFPGFARFVKRARSRFASVDRTFHSMARFAPMSVRRVLRETEPELY